MTARLHERETRGTKVLHVEDNPENRALVRALLESEGYVVIDAEDGPAGIEAAIREEPALVLLDINLPGLDGYELGVMLRSFPALSGTPIVAITAYGMEGDRERSLVAGCDGYIRKPIDVDGFPRQIAAFLRGQRERVEEPVAAPFLRELNQRFVHRLVSQVEELRRLNQHFVRRAVQLEDLHAAVRDITAEVGVRGLLERLLPALARALGVTRLGVELADPPGLRIEAPGDAAPGRGVVSPGTEREWTVPLAVHEHRLGTMTARQRLADGATAGEEPLLKIVANQVAIAVENARLYEDMVRRASEEESLVEAGRLLTSTLDLSEVLERLAELVRVRLAADLVRIWLLGPGGELRSGAHAGAGAPEASETMVFRPGEGLVGRVLAVREPVAVVDIETAGSVKYREDLRRNGVRSFLGVPLLLEDQAVGVLGIGSAERREFTGHEVALAQALASSAAAAIRNAHLYEETGRRLRQTETLLSISQAVGSTLDIPEVFRRATREMVRTLGASTGGAWLLQGDRTMLPIAAYRAPKALLEAFASAGFPVDHPLVDEARRLEGPIGSSDSQADPRFSHPLFRLIAHRSLLLAPIRSRGEVIGGFVVAWTDRSHAFTYEELRLVDGIARQTAVATENARLLWAEREARERLQASEALYRDLFENAIDLVYVHDLEGRLLALNGAGARITGYAPEELRGLTIDRLMSSEDAARARQAAERLARGERIHELFSFELIRKDGTRAIVECAARPVRREDGGAVIQGVARDVTERRKLERRQAAFLELVKELSAEGDFDRLFTLIGRRACELIEADSAVLSLVENDEILVRSTHGIELPPHLAEPRPLAGSHRGRVLARRTPHVSSDLEADPDWRDARLVRALGYRAAVHVPIVLRGEAIGVLALLHRTPRAFRDDDVALLVSFAEHTALAIDRMNLLGALETRLRETETLLSVSQAVGSTLDLPEVFRRATREIVRTLGADLGGAWLLRPPRGLVPIAGYRLSSDLVGAVGTMTLALDNPLLVVAHELEGPIAATDSQADPRFTHPVFRAIPHTSLLFVPIRTQREIIGAFGIAWLRDRHSFTPQEIRLVEGLGQQVAVAIENARLLEAEREARERLAVSETRYRELFDSVIDIVLLHDLEGRVLEVNEPGARAIGYPREQLRGMSLGEFLRPADVQQLMRSTRRLFAGDGEVDPFVVELVRPDATRATLECLARPIYKDGQPFAVLASARDITAKRRLEQREEALTALSRELATEIDLERLLPRIAEEARRLMGMSTGLVLMVEGDGLAVRGYSGPANGLEAIPALSVASSLSGTVVRERRPLVYANLAADPAWRDTPIARAFGYRAMVAVPLIVKEQVLGALKVLDAEARPFPPEEISFLRTLATQAALAIDNARLFAARREEAEVSAALLRLAEAIEGVQDLERVLDVVVATTADLLEGTQCLLFLHDQGTDALRPAAASGLPEAHRDAFLSLTALADLPEVRAALAGPEPVVLSGDSPGLAATPALGDTLAVRAMMLIPLVSGGRSMGVIGLHTPGERRALAGKQVTLARGIAAHAAVAIDRAQLFGQTQRRLRETETLLNVARALSATLDPGEAMRRVAAEIGRTLGADMVGAYLADETHHVLHPIAGYHVPERLRATFTEFSIPLAGHQALEEAWRSHQPLVATDAATDPRIDRAAFERLPHRSLLFVPMIAKGEPIGGFVAIWWTERRRLEGQEIQLVQGISDQAAVFVENARLYSEATRHRREAEELARLARMLTESLDAIDVSQRIAESALGLMGARFAVVRMLQPDRSLKLLAARGDAGAVARTLPVLSPGTGTMGRAVAEARACWSADDLADPRTRMSGEERARLAELGHTAFLAVPLRVKREITGVVGLGFAGSRTFTDAEVALVQTFADQAAIALENSRLYGDLRAALRAVEESQQRVIQGERLRALGELAGGIAHDFNNVLAIIVGRAEVLLEETEDPELRRQLDVIVKVALDAAQTVKRIQEFTRMRRARPFQQVHLHQLLEEIVDVTRSRWKNEAQVRGIAYELALETVPVPPVLGDPSELREALTNIIFNALDAMPEGGRIALGTRTEGDRVVCTISDTGVGMSEDVRQRIFDPFFTTKGERGTGLGLSVVYGIVARHKGEIDVESRLGHGSTFTIRLPVGTVPEAEAAATPRPAARTSGRVLVVDDEQDVGQILAQMLARDGHEVVTCTDGSAALDRFETDAFDLVITDLGMPGLSGWDVAQRVKLRRPSVPVAMVTGWGDRIDPAEALARGIDYVVSKPFKRESIREVVGAALADPRARGWRAGPAGGA